MMDDAARGPGAHSPVPRLLLWVSRASFAVSVLLVLLTPSWELFARGVFTAWPLARVRLGAAEFPVGVLLLIPAVAALSWLLARLLERPRRRWRWGPLHTTLPIAGLGALVLVRTGPVHDPQRGVEVLLAVCFLWGVYLYVLQDWPEPWAQATLALVTLLQGLAATGQFFLQRSLGLYFLGEPVLNPETSGICVIESGGQRWLRAYGLTPHPDLLGVYLGLGLLVCLGALLSFRGWRRYALLPCLAAGGLGLFLSFSRSAWLGTLAGLAYWLIVARPWRQANWAHRSARRTLLLPLVVLGCAGVALGLTYADLLASRFLRLDNPLERRSIQDRQSGLGEAWNLIRGAPLTGVGSGRYLEALWERAGADPPLGFRRVYNVPLLATAELGLPGALLWLWMVLAPPVLVAWRSRGTTVPVVHASWAAALVIVVVFSQFQYYLYLLPGWWYTLYPTILLGAWAQKDLQR